MKNNLTTCQLFYWKLCWLPF